MTLANNIDQAQAKLGWSNDPAKNQTLIFLRRPPTDPLDQADWPKQHQWLFEKIELFRKVFGPRIKNLADQTSPATNGEI